MLLLPTLLSYFFSSSFVFYIAALVHFIVLLSCLWLVGYVDIGLSCSRPLRGIGWGLAVMITVGFMSIVLTHYHINIVFRRFVSTSSAVIRETAIENDEDSHIHERTGLTHQQTEMIVSRAITDRMMYGCCSTCTFILSTIILLVLTIIFFIFTVAQSNDCHTSMKTFVRNGSYVCIGLVVVLVSQCILYTRFIRDFILCYEIHFMEQQLIKEEVRIRE